MLALILRDLRLAYRHRGEIVTAALFFVIIVCIFPLSVTPRPALLTAVGPGLLWMGALLATLLSMDRLFRLDFADGSLEQILLAPRSLSLLVLAKTVAHWLVTGLPVIVASPLLAMMYELGSEATLVMMAALLLGTPVLSLIGAIGVALTLGLRQAGALLALLVLPLYVPVLIFGASAVAAAVDGSPYGPQLYMLGAFLLLAMTLAPAAAAGALRISVD